jgi:uncharacterized membrane protein YgcG
MNFPQTHYAMSSDPAPFVPPERYPSPPKNMWYEVPKEPPAHLTEKPKPVFPWESHQPRPTRVFTNPIPPPPEPPVTAAEPTLSASSPGGAETFPPTGLQQTQHGAESPASEQAVSEPQTPPPPQGGAVPPSHAAVSASSAAAAATAPPTATGDIWSSFPRTNAWDNVPEINRYVDRTLQRHRRTWSRNLALSSGKGAAAPGEEEPLEFGFARRGSKVTDFPSEDDRPSLPVTPAPIRRPRRRPGYHHGGGDGPGGNGFGGWGGDVGGEDEEQLPAAEGVPGQADWVCVHGIWWGPADCLCDLTNVLRYHKDPAAQLQKLAKEQSELLFQRLAAGGGGGGESGGGSGGGYGLGREEEREIPARPLPFGSENVRSPTYVAPRPPVPVVSPTPVKPHTGASPVNKILAAAPEIISAQERPPAAAATTTTTWGSANPIARPSYQGPGVAFEKGEDIPTRETPALPTEEERDVLET